MKISEYAALDAVGLAELVRHGDVRREEVAQAAVAAIEKANPRVNALAGQWLDEALQAEAKPGAPLAGVPFLIKDLAVHMKGKPSEFGSRLAQGLTPERDSFLMRRFREAGLVTLGRTTSPEMAFSTTTESAFNGPTRNPWDLSRSAGGSSGGAAAAVASGMVPIAHATDAAGSIRVPASLCGLFGLKPTRGRVSNGPALDEVFNGFGTQLAVSRSVRDTATLLDAIAGAEPGDPYSAHPPSRPYALEAATEPGPLRIGLQMVAWNGARPTAEVQRETEAAVQLCRSLGHLVTEARMPVGMSWEAFVHANAQVWCGNLVSWVDDIAAAMGRRATEEYLEPSTLACYEYGRRMKADDFVRALAARNTVARTAAAFFAEHDLILTPTMPDVAPRLATYEQKLRSLDGLAWTELVFEHAPYMAIFNVAGFPAMTLPLGQDQSTGLPIGIQFGAAFGREDTLLQLAGQVERAAPWRHRLPAAWVGR